MRFQKLNCSLQCLPMSVKSEVQDLSLTKGGALVRTRGIGGGPSQRPRCNVSPIPAREGQVLSGRPQLGRGERGGRTSGGQEGDSVRSYVVSHRKYHCACLLTSAHSQQSDSQRVTSLQPLRHSQPWTAVQPGSVDWLEGGDLRQVF